MNDGAASHSGPPLVLHAGCGRTSLPGWLSDHREVRLDIDASTQPDIVASMTDLGDIGPFNAVYCCHALEHLHPDDVDQALREFHRVLLAGGYAMIVVPNLAGVKPTEDVLYVSPAGPITGLDMIYGKRDMTRDCAPMMHRTGFVAETLEAALRRAGFDRVHVNEGVNFNLMGAGAKA